MAYLEGMRLCVITLKRHGPFYVATWDGSINGAVLHAGEYPSEDDAWDWIEALQKADIVEPE